MPLELTARVMSRDGAHARINVWQNHGLAGTLTVDAAVADEVAGLINGATAMLSAIHERYSDYVETAESDYGETEDPDWVSTFQQILHKAGHDA